MRLLAITPIAVSEDELARRQQRYDRLAPPGVEVVLENLGTGVGVPAALETASDVAASEEVLVRRFATCDPAGYDAFLPDCVLDPVVDRAVELPRPVHGIARLATHLIASLGRSFTAVARNQAIASELDHRFATYGLVPVQRTAVLDLSVDDISDDAIWADAVGEAVADLDCDVVVNACSAVEVRPGSGGPTILDPTATALQVLALSEGGLR